MRDQPEAHRHDPYAAPVAEPPEALRFRPYPDLPLASRGNRLLARVVDNVLLLLAVSPGIFLVGFGDELAVTDSLQSDLMLASGAFLLLSFPMVLLALNVWLLVRDGQTPGKRVAGVRIVTLQGGRAGWNDLLVKRIGLTWLINIALSCVGLNSLFALGDALFIFRADRRCIHDLLAGTTVVEAAHRPWD